MFFKDADRMYSSMARRGTASALGDGFNRRMNPIHGADLACRSVKRAPMTAIAAFQGHISVSRSPLRVQEPVEFLWCLESSHLRM